MIFAAFDTSMNIRTVIKLRSRSRSSKRVKMCLITRQFFGINLRRKSQTGEPSTQFASQRHLPLRRRKCESQPRSAGDFQRQSLNHPENKLTSQAVSKQKVLLIPKPIQDSLVPWKGGKEWSNPTKKLPHLASARRGWLEVSVQ